MQVKRSNYNTLGFEKYPFTNPGIEGVRHYKDKTFYVRLPLIFVIKNSDHFDTHKSYQKRTPTETFTLSLCRVKKTQ